MMGVCVGDGRPLNTVQVEHPSHTGALLYGLNALRSKGLLLDVTLMAGAEAFQAHRVVLASCSEYFRAMFTDEMKERCQSEICLNGVSAAGLRCLLEYAYTSRLSLNLANVQDVLAAAAHVQVHTVVEACSNYLQGQLDLDNCVDIATIAETYSLNVLRKKVYSFMSSHLHQFNKMAEFYRLTRPQLLHLLSCDYPVDCSEAEVLQTVVGWIQHQGIEENVQTHKLLASINWSEVPASLANNVSQFINVGNSNSSVSQVSIYDSLGTPPPPTTTTVSTHNHHGMSSTLVSSSSSSSQMSSNQVSLVNIIPSTPEGLINSRGLELAVVKVGGFSIGGITNEITYYLPSHGRWKHLTSIPHVEQCNFGTAVLNNELYVVGGCFDQSLQENIHPFGFRYNPQHDKWTTIAPMKRERCRFTLSIVAGQLYAVGGACESPEGGGAPHGDESSCEVYDPANDGWTTIMALPGARAQHATATLSSLMFVTGGLEGDNVLDSCMVYNTITGVWKSQASLLTPRADHVCFTFKGKIYLCGGWYEEENSGGRILVETIDCYDLSSNSWLQVGKMQTPRYHAGIVVVGSCLYVIGGLNSDSIFDRATGAIECFDLDEMSWHTQTSYPQDIWEHVCVPLYIPRCRDDMDVLSIPPK